MSWISFETFSKKYTAICLLYQGLLGDVYKIRSNATLKQYALKTFISPTLQGLSAAISQLEIIRKIEGHRSTPQVLYYFLSKIFINNQMFMRFSIIMELYQTSLADQIERIKTKRRNPFTLQQVWEFLVQTTSCLQYFQTIKLIHKDIKPQNIMIKYEGGQRIYKIIDYASSSFSETPCEEIIGSENYESPRIKQKFDLMNIVIAPNNTKDDVYSLGKIVIQMLFLKCFRNDEIDQRTFKTISLSFDPVIAGLLRKMLQGQQENRFNFTQIVNEIKKIKGQQTNSKNQLVQTQEQNQQHKKQFARILRQFDDANKKVLEYQNAIAVLSQQHERTKALLIIKTEQLSKAQNYIKQQELKSEQQSIVQSQKSIQHFESQVKTRIAQYEEKITTLSQQNIDLKKKLSVLPEPDMNNQEKNQQPVQKSLQKEQSIQTEYFIRRRLPCLYPLWIQNEFRHKDEYLEDWEHDEVDKLIQYSYDMLRETGRKTTRKIQRNTNKIPMTAAQLKEFANQEKYIKSGNIQSQTQQKPITQVVEAVAVRDEQKK